MKYRIIPMAALLAAVAFVAIAGSANARPSSVKFSATSSWTHLGGDPIVPGGVHSPQQVQHMLHSQPGRNAMRAAGLSFAEATAVQNARFVGCGMRYGQWFQAMTYGRNGTKFEGPVQFLDRSYRGNPASAWCAHVRVGNVMLNIMIPEKCANFGLVSRTRLSPPVHKPVPPRSAPKKKPAPSGNCNIVNSPNSNACNQTTIYVICSNGVTVQVNTQGKTTQEIKDAVQQACTQTSTPPPTTTVTTTTTETTTTETTTTTRNRPPPPPPTPKDCKVNCHPLP